MDTLTLNSKGQITIPASVRKDLGLKPGSTVRLSRQPDQKGFTITKTVSILDAAEMFPKSKHSATIEEMDQAISDAAVERYLKSK